MSDIFAVPNDWWRNRNQKVPGWNLWLAVKPVHFADTVVWTNINVAGLFWLVSMSAQGTSDT